MGLYGSTNGSLAPKLQTAELTRDDQIKLTYDKSLDIQYFNGTTATKAQGFRIEDGTTILTDDNITLTTIEGNAAYINLSSEISQYAMFSLGSKDDAKGKPVLSDNGTSTPVRMIFNISLVVPSSSISTEDNSATSSGGGLPTYLIPVQKMEEGYSKNLAKDWKLNFRFEGDTHRLNLDNLNKNFNTATITISSDPQTKTLKLGEEWKVNLNNDTYFFLFK